ncbi:HAMP domain-containing protein [Planococcaceae bacterium Storch 2/2-2]|nr:HAMP domain-containing protein [Planococcaceae bacterium Storch 2/2-2]
MKLRVKMPLLYTTLFTIIFALMSVIVYILFAQTTLEGEQAQLETHLDELMATVHSTNKALPVTTMRAFLPSEGEVLIRKNDEIVFHIASTYEVMGEDVPLLSGERPILWNGEVHTLHMTQYAPKLLQMLRRLALILTLVNAIAIILTITMSIFLSNQLVAPLSEITAVMRRGRKSNQIQTMPIDESKDDEITEVKRTYNELMTALARQVEREKEFLNDASHELKTPLTIIDSYAGLLKRRGVDDPAVVRESLQAITHETARMNELIEQLLDSAKNEHRGLKMENVSVDQLLRRMIHSFETTSTKHWTLAGIAKTKETDAALLEQLFYILLSNANQYSDHRIIITLKEDCCVIENDGGGIPKESIPHLFKRFYRVDDSRARDRGGTGLGLAIARSIADRLSLEIEVTSDSEKWTTVTIRGRDDE